MTTKCWFLELNFVCPAVIPGFIKAMHVTSINVYLFHLMSRSSSVCYAYWHDCHDHQRFPFRSDCLIASLCNIKMVFENHIVHFQEWKKPNQNPTMNSMDIWCQSLIKPTWSQYVGIIIRLLNHNTMRYSSHWSWLLAGQEIAALTLCLQDISKRLANAATLPEPWMGQTLNTHLEIGACPCWSVMLTNCNHLSNIIASISR